MVVVEYVCASKVFFYFIQCSPATQFLIGDVDRADSGGRGRGTECLQWEKLLALLFLLLLAYTLGWWGGQWL